MGQLNLKKTDTPQTPSSGWTGIYIDSTNAPILILEDGSEIPLGGTTLEQIYIDAITGGNSPSSENPFVTLEDLNALTGGINSIIYGGNIQWSGSGLIFDASASGYIIEGVFYEVIQDTLTLTTADATNDRRDRFKLTVSGWAFDTGTPAPTPVAPNIDPITEIDRGDVLIEALATTPTVTNEDVYLENTEWVTSSGGTGTFDPNSVTDPFAGTKAFEATNIQAGGFMLFTKSIDFDISTSESIGLQLKLKATMNNGRSIRVQFFDSLDVAVSQSIPLPIVKNNSTTYQFCALNVTELGFVSTTVRKVKLTYAGTGGPASFSGFYIDNVIIQAGIGQGYSPTFTQDEIDAVKGSNSPSSSNVFATIADVGGSGISGSGTSNEIAYFTGPTTLASLVVASYPSLTEFSYMKGVTSAVQTQINGKQEAIAGTATEGYVATAVSGIATWAAPSGGGGGLSGLTADKITKATSANTVGDSGITEESSTAYLFGTRTPVTSATPLAVSFGGTVGNSAAGSNANLKWKLFDNAIANDSYGIGMSSSLMELRAGVNGAIGFFVNNGTEAMRVLSTGHLQIGEGKVIITSSIQSVLGGPATVINSKSSILISDSVTGASSTPLYISVGSSYGTGTAGASSNLKFRLYDAGSGSSGNYGIGMSASLMEFRTGTGAAMGFFPNNGVEAMRILSSGDLQFSNAKNIIFNATTGTKIGTATTQKLAFWNKTPINQPTNAITAAAFVANSSGIADDTATYGGYTIGQLAAIIINTGLTA